MISKFLKFSITIFLTEVFCFQLNADNFVPRYKAKYEYTREGMNLKGNVFSVKESKVLTAQRFGEEYIAGEEFLNSVTFDSKGRFCETQNATNLEDVRHNKLFFWKNNEKVVIVSSDKDTTTIVYTLNDAGALTEKYQRERYQESKWIYSPIPNGYRLTYYPTASAAAKVYDLINGRLTTKYDYSTEVTTYGQDGNLIKYTRTRRSLQGNQITSTTTRDYVYNSNGDLVSVTETTTGIDYRKPFIQKLKMVYEYDQNGNWVSRKVLVNDFYEDKKNRPTWVKREITYLSPEEIDSYYKNELTARMSRRDSLIESRQNVIKDVYEYHFRNHLNQGIYEFADKNRPYYGSHIVKFNCTPVESASKTGEKYSFRFPDGTEVDDVEFERIDDKSFYSPESHVVMVLQEFFDEKENKSYAWYVGRIEDGSFDRYNKMLTDALESDLTIRELRERNPETEEIGQINVDGHVSTTDIPSVRVGTAYYVPLEYNGTLGFPSSMDEVTKAGYQKMLNVQAETIRKKGMVEKAMSYCQISTENRTGIAQKIKKLSENKNSTSYKPTFDIELQSGKKYSGVSFPKYEEGAFISDDGTLLLFNSSPFTEKGKSVIPYFIVELDNNGLPASANYIIQDPLKNNILMKAFQVRATR